jgi:hypothetical protein
MVSTRWSQSSTMDCVHGDWPGGVVRTEDAAATLPLVANNPTHLDRLIDSNLEKWAVKLMLQNTAVWPEGKNVLERRVSSEVLRVRGEGGWTGLDTSRSQFLGRIVFPVTFEGLYGGLEKMPVLVPGRNVLRGSQAGLAPPKIVCENPCHVLGACRLAH